MFMQKFSVLPNYLTILRLIFVPIIFSLILIEHYTLAFVFFLLANITDILDGRIARKYNFITEFGKLLDPLADKITQISTISALIIKDIIPFWILVIIATKEIIMMISSFVLFRKEITIVHSMWYGKLSTIILFIAIIFSLLSKSFETISSFSIYLYYIAIFTTLFAGIMYAIKILKENRKKIITLQKN